MIRRCWLTQQRAIGIVRQFGAELPKVREALDLDVTAAYQGDPAAHSADEVLLCYPGVTAMIHHRLANVLYRLGVPMLARMVAEIAHADTGIDIHPGATIGRSFFIDHGTGVVIGETAIIGDRVRHQMVTLGAKRFPPGENGELKKGLPRHPLIEDDVVIYAGATILGRITIGKGSTIGGNVWLTRSAGQQRDPGEPGQRHARLRVGRLTSRRARPPVRASVILGAWMDTRVSDLAALPSTATRGCSC